MSGKAKAKPIKETVKALLYARVSSKEQEKEGFSIPAQLKLLREYAATNGIAILEEYVDIETARQSGRTSFGEMVKYFRKRPSVRTLLVEKTDRLYRNLKDWVTFDELDVEIHFVKEGFLLSRDSRSSEKFMHGIKVLMAKNYIDNLSEEARKGMQEKAEQGIWPTKAPLGYRNVTAPHGKKIIEPDPEVAPIVAHMFYWYVTGTISLKVVAENARAMGLTYRRTGATVPVSAVHTVLRNRIYTGEFEWKGRRFRGQHKALITRELWERVQGVLDGRHATKHRHAKHEFAFSHLITCGHCGCSLVGERKKGKYVYYHCTGFKGKCGEPYVREEVLEAEFSKVLGSLRFNEEVFEWVRKALRDSHTEQKQECDAAIERHRAERERLQNRIHAMYIDKLDGKIDDAFFRRMSAQWRDEQLRCEHEIGLIDTADRDYLESGVRLLELAQDARRLFDQQGPEEKYKLLKFVVSNSTWQHGVLTTTLRQPFDLLAETAAIVARLAGPDGAISPGHPVWLGD
ncbi:MAG TPA: recombinase family protein [Stellaceae bacterium]|nr:recombinase family protein [Stellaceae bacterium]